MSRTRGAPSQKGATVVAERRASRENWPCAAPFHGFTCDECGAVAHCELAFDPLNTDGYCLAEK